MGYTAELSLYSYPILASKHMVGHSEGFTSILESNLNKFWYALNNNDTSIIRKHQRFSLPLRSRRWLMKILLLFRMLERTCAPGDHMLSLRDPETCSHCGSDHPASHSRARATASPLAPAVPKYLMNLRTGPYQKPCSLTRAMRGFWYPSPSY